MSLLFGVSFINSLPGVLLGSFVSLYFLIFCFVYDIHLSCRKLLKNPGETVLRVLKMVSKIIKDQTVARKFADVLLALSSDGIKNSG